MEYLLFLMIAVAALAAIASPLMRGASTEGTGAADQLEELEAQKLALYREIRDTELDWRTGKISEEQWRGQDRALRARALELLREIERLERVR